MLPIVLPGRTPVASSTPGESAPLDLDDVNDARSLAVLSVPPQGRVLEVGSGSVAVARALAARGHVARIADYSRRDWLANSCSSTIVASSDSSPGLHLCTFS